MTPAKITRKKAVKNEHSWFYRHFGSIIFSTLVFSTVAYAIAWPTVPGEAGYPVEWSFWNFFDKMLVNTGGSTDGTVKKSESLGKGVGRVAIVTDANGNIWVGTGSATGYTMSVSGQALFSDTVLGTAPTASWHLATKGYVDGVVSAWGGGGYNQCYRVANTTPAYPACATWYTRAYSAYGDSTWSNPVTVNIHFENNIGWAWFQNFGHVYLYYEHDATYNVIRFYDDQDRFLSQGSHNYVPTTLSDTFSSKNSTYMSYTTQSPVTYTMFWNLSDFWYAVCCK
jgi:hypothetical protein